MLAMHEKGLEMLDLSGTKEEPVFAEDTLRVLSVYSKDHVTNVLVTSSCMRVTKLDILEAHAIGESKLRVLMAKDSGLYRHEVHGIIGIDGSSPVIAAVYGTLRDPLFIDLELSDVILYHAGLPLVVLPEELLTRDTVFIIPPSSLYSADSRWPSRFLDNSLPAKCNLSEMSCRAVQKCNKEIVEITLSIKLYSTSD
jgi:hypothetical protein